MVLSLLTIKDNLNNRLQKLADLPIGWEENAPRIPSHVVKMTKGFIEYLTNDAQMPIPSIYPLSSRGGGIRLEWVLPNRMDISVEFHACADEDVQSLQSLHSIEFYAHVLNLSCLEDEGQELSGRYSDYFHSRLDGVKLKKFIINSACLKQFPAGLAAYIFQKANNKPKKIMFDGSIYVAVYSEVHEEWIIVECDQDIPLFNVTFDNIIEVATKGSDYYLLQFCLPNYLSSALRINNNTTER